MHRALENDRVGNTRLAQRIHCFFIIGGMWTGQRMGNQPYKSKLTPLVAYGTETGDRMIGTGPDAGWNLFHANGGDDQIHVDGLVADPLALALAEDGVNDQIYSSSLVQNTAYGGAGDDLLLGGREFDALHGGSGDDVLVGAAEAIWKEAA